MSKEFEYLLEEVKKISKQREIDPESRWSESTKALELIEEAIENVLKRLKNDIKQRSLDEFDRYAGVISRKLR